MLGCKEEICSSVYMFAQFLAFAPCLGIVLVELAWCKRIKAGDVAAELERDLLVRPMGVSTFWYVRGAVDPSLNLAFGFTVHQDGIEYCGGKSRSRGEMMGHNGRDL